MLLRMLERFRELLTNSALFPLSSRVLVGYSGGADSTCMLHLLWSTGVEVVAAHLHHGMRPEADEEQQRCQAFCEQLDVPLALGRADVPLMAEKFKIGIEEAGRRARYDFLERAAYGAGCGYIATAHTLDDHIETVLMHLVRGAGMSGLSGIPRTRGRVVRPLLDFSRQETREYCHREGLWFHDDPANSDLSFTRARIRHRVIPELLLVNAKACENIGRSAGLVGEEDRFLDGMAAAALERAERKLNGELGFLTLDCEIALGREALVALPRVLLRRALRLSAQALGAKLDYDQVRCIVEGLAEGGKGAVTCEGGDTVLEWDAEMLHARRLLSAGNDRMVVAVPGETTSENGWKILAQPIERLPAELERRTLTLDLDSRCLAGQLYLRPVKSGDSLQPLGFEGSRKIADLMSEAGLTLAARARLPILCDMVGPVWIPGVCVDQRASARSETPQPLRITFGPNKDAEGC